MPGGGKLSKENVSVATSVAIMANVGNGVAATQTDRQPLQGSSLSVAQRIRTPGQFADLPNVVLWQVSRVRTIGNDVPVSG